MRDKAIFKLVLVVFLIITSALAGMLVMAAVFRLKASSGAAGIAAVGGGVSVSVVRWISLGIVVSIILIYLISRRRRLR